MMTEAEQREKVITTAQSFLRTPYHHRGMTRAGLDCATLILLCAMAAEIVPTGESLPYYPFQWNVNASRESLIDFIRKFCPEFPGPPKPASLVVWKMGRTFSHGAIVVKWPMCIHAKAGSGVEWVDAEKDNQLAMLGDEPRPRLFFDHWYKPW